MGILSGNQQQEPLNYGEIAGLWGYLMGVNGAVSAYTTFLNHCGDTDLKKYIEDKINNQMKPQIQQIETILKSNGVAIPPAAPEKPVASLDSIPAGARFNDNEIAATIAQNTATGLTSLSTIIGTCTREDIATLCGTFHMEVGQYGLRLLKIQKEKGWLIPPPLHKDTPELAHV